MKIPSIKLPKRPPKTPEVLEAEIAERAARRAARISAKGKARTKLDEARDGVPVRSLLVLIVRWSSLAALMAAILIILAGYWYDLLFYSQQHTSFMVVVGLIAFAVVVRTVATAGDVILHNTRPGKDPEGKKGGFFRGMVTDNYGVRMSLRVMWIGSILACSVATLSFFSAGHETRQATSAGLETTEKAITDSKAGRIAALSAQKAEALEARDTAIRAADQTIANVKDNVEGLSAADNETLRQADEAKNTATSDYNQTLKALNAQINKINSEKETEIKEVTVDRVTAVPFLTVYKFLSRWFGTAEAWTIAGAWFFAILFELLCAKLLSTVFALMKVLRHVAQKIELQEAADEMQSRIALERMRANIEIDAIRLRAAQAQERAAADIELAHREREIEKARAQAEALRTGTVWIDPDELLKEETALRQAENDVRIRKLREQAEKVLAGEEATDAPKEPQRGAPDEKAPPEAPEKTEEKPEPKDEEPVKDDTFESDTDEDPRIKQARAAAEARWQKERAKGLDKRIPVGDWREEQRAAAE